ncbi:EG45-like domain containing protein 2 [Eucalyptus grandis]|uniref:EG45-like domain containing protein 2 n=1 Tax=Eucalyptus grandis TaxID=71139 RepID=UPI00192EBDE4|nr:EG45-like domain containing protein 2 [Eucalyptus grandis]
MRRLSPNLVCCSRSWLIHGCRRRAQQLAATRSLLQSPLLLLLLLWVHRAVAKNGTASYYGPPYERTECYGEGSLQFPVSNLFMAVGDGLWDLGAACGREYELRCIGDAQSGPGGCKPGANNIRVKVVDYALSVESSAAAPRQSVTGTDLVLSWPAFEAIASPSVDSIKVGILTTKHAEFLEYK